MDSSGINPMLRHIILLSGKQGAGKTALASNLLSYLKKFAATPVWVEKFAAPIYRIHDAVRRELQDMDLDIKLDEFDHVQSFEGIDGPLCQVIGTDWGRKSRGENIWVRAMGRKIVREVKQGEIVLIDDCRFPNELLELSKYISNAIFCSIRLEAPEHIRKPRAAKWRPNTNHPSEVGLDYHIKQFDVVIDTQVNTQEQTLNAAVAALRSKFYWSK